MRGLLIVFAACLLTGCGQAGAVAERKSSRDELSQQAQLIVRQKAEISRLEAQNSRLKRAMQIMGEEHGRRVAPTVYDSADEPEAGDFAPVKTPVRQPMCYKDYCPCEPPQGGMDSILCDQLDEGIEVSADMMIAGRGAREVRRQIATGDY